VTEDAAPVPAPDPAAIGASDPGEAAAPSLDAGDAAAPSLDAGDAAAPSLDAGDAAAPSLDAGDAAAPSLDAGDASLLALVDRLGVLLDRSDLSELAVQAGSTRLVLRKPGATAPLVIAAPAPAPQDGVPAAGSVVDAPAGASAPARPTVNAPLTGVWYGSPAPGSAPFVAVGREVAVGQVIGLIEAMKLFNEIKSDLAGRVVRVVPENGALVKAKQPLIEVEPL
jgi:acetyl-CoA carboxylase biotin carboxyl carrier protein